MESEDRLPKRSLVLASSDASKRAVLQKKGSSVLAVTAVGYVAEEDADALDCGVCFLPLKPPIFQCEVGHVVCSSCHDGLAATGNGKCHVCGVSTASDGYRRCDAMERMVESVRLLCPNAVYGCSARPLYYDQHCHGQSCVHAPCHCPGAACGFIGSTAALFAHFSSTHSWPCTTKVLERNNKRTRYMWFRNDHVNVRLRDGFNFLLFDRHADDDQGAVTNTQYLFLLNVVRQPLGRAITVFWINPNADASYNCGQGGSSKKMKFELSYSRHGEVTADQLIANYDQSSKFVVATCTDLSDGLPSLDGCVQFIVLDSVVAHSDRDAIEVKARVVF
ncbi:hypothetical protein EJB05_33810, partial [Eragrostis curvula]